MNGIADYMGKSNAILGGVMLFFPLILFAILLLIMLIRGIILKRRDDRAPVLTAGATVAEMYNPVTMDVHQRRSAYCAVTFALANGQRLKLQVTPAQYDALTLGSRGILTYQGKRYLEFTKEHREVDFQ